MCDSGQHQVPRSCVFHAKNGDAFTIKVIESEEDKANVLRFMHHNWAHIHPLTKLFGLDADSVNSAWADGFNRSFRSPTSLIAYAANGELAALKLNSIYEGDSDIKFSDKVRLHLFQRAPGSGLWNEQDVLCALSHLCDRIDDPLERFGTFFEIVWKDFVRQFMPNAKRMLKFENLAVTPKFVGLGLGEELCRISLQIGRQHGCDSAFTSATVAASQHIQRKCGFICGRSIVYSKIAHPLFQDWDPAEAKALACEMFYINL